MSQGPLDVRFRQSLEALRIGDRPLHLLVALSGGLDSTTLLHLLRFRCGGLRLFLTAAHFDHRMRDSSPADARWVRGLCLSWRVPLEVDAAATPLRSEEEAREARYRFLRDTARRVGADRIATGHHADDQAETVLFRILRGTGLPGLGGIPRRTAAGVVRPLLPFWREELEAYAAQNRLAWRIDPSNASHGPARNRIRHSILPEIERYVSRSARRNLVSLAELARESETGWQAVVDTIFGRVATVSDDAVLLAREDLRRYDPALGTRVVRKALRRFGIVPDRAGTRSALQFITDAASGREMQLSSGVRVRVEFDQARIFRVANLPEDRGLVIPLRPGGEIVDGPVLLGGRQYRVSARVVERSDEPAVAPGSPGRWHARLTLGAGRFPLRVRARAPGDRIATRSGARSLKKLMIQRRVPLSERTQRPVLADAEGRVLWVAGLETGVATPDDEHGLVLELTIRDG